MPCLILFARALSDLSSCPSDFYSAYVVMCVCKLVHDQLALNGSKRYYANWCTANFQSWSPWIEEVSLPKESLLPSSRSDHSKDQGPRSSCSEFAANLPMITALVCRWHSTLKEASKEKAAVVLDHLLSEFFSSGVFVMIVDVSAGVKRPWVIEGTKRVRVEITECQMLVEPLLTALPLLKQSLFGNKKKTGHYRHEDEDSGCVGSIA